MVARQPSWISFRVDYLKNRSSDNLQSFTETCCLSGDGCCRISSLSDIRYGCEPAILNFLLCPLSQEPFKRLPLNFYWSLLPMRGWVLSNFRPVWIPIRPQASHLEFPFVCIYLKNRSSDYLQIFTEACCLYGDGHYCISSPSHIQYGHYATKVTRERCDPRFHKLKNFGVTFTRIHRDECFQCQRTTNLLPLDLSLSARPTIIDPKIKSSWGLITNEYFSKFQLPTIINFMSCDICIFSNLTSVTLTCV